MGEITLSYITFCESVYLILMTDLGVGCGELTTHQIWLRNVEK